MEMAAGRLSLAKLRVEGLLHELLGSGVVWSIEYSYSEELAVLCVKVAADQPVIVFKEPVEEFPSEKLKTQLMLIAPVKK